MLPKKSPTMYELVIPSTGAKVRYRPYTIREEKLLMIAEQSGDVKVMINALREIIKQCTNEEVDPESLAIFDLEYFMAQLRAKSVGESVKLQFQCDNDPKHPMMIVDLDMSKIEVKKTEGHTKTIKLFGDVGVIMRYPDINMIESLQTVEVDPDIIFGIIYDCIDSIFDSKEVHKASEQSPEQIVEFIDQLDKVEFKKIEEFFTTMPKFSHTIEYTCPVCSTKHVKDVEGFENFF